MNIFCPEPCITCAPIPLGAEGIFPNPNSEASPYANFSSELPDQIIFIGTNPNPTVDGPPLGYIATGCVGICFSTVSQEEANLCAARQAILCPPFVPPQRPNPPPGEPQPPPTPPLPVFASAAQQCSVQCPDGSFSGFTVVAGKFLEFNQQLANDKAYSYACGKAFDNALCFGSLSPTQGCKDESMSSSVAVSSVGNRPVTFTIIDGALPPGMTMQTSINGTTALISGTPTSNGAYTFTLQAVDSLGNSKTKTFGINIIEIATPAPTLPPATLNSAYSFTFTSGGSVGANPTWAVTGGSLPPGLTLNSVTGEVSGTPTTAGTYLFGITLFPSN